MVSNEPPYLRYLFSKAREKNVPLSATFELTSRCNFNCKMCYIHDSESSKLKEKELTTQQWIDIADKAKDAGSLLLLITGGEPLLRPDFPEIYVHCKKIGLEVSVNTNASLITDEHIAMFREYPPNRLNVSLYGACEETYANVTCRSGYYKKVTDTIKKLREAEIAVKISVTVSSYNSGDLPELFKIAKSFDVPIETACYLFPSARLGKETDRPSPQEAARNMITSDICYFESDKLHERAKSLCRIDECVGEKEKTRGTGMKCRGGITALWITYDGIMLPCGMMTKPCSSVIENGFAQAWKEVNEATKKIVLPEKCSKCKFEDICESCAAACYTETGSFSEVPEYLCKKTQEYVRITKEELNK